MSTKKFVIVALALGGTLAAGAASAHGRDDVQWSVTIGSQVGAPVYSQPAPVSAPPPVYAPPPAIGAERQYHRRSRWDADGDGIPNRYDRVYNPPWDRDGDGIPNRHDRHDDRRHRPDERSGWRP